jgi:hypothetical protein
MSYPFELRKKYSFDVYPVALLGNDFKNCTILSIMDHDQAVREIDTAALHVQFFPFLPDGTPNRAQDYDYVKIKTLSGNTTILGMAWINLSTVVLVTSIQLRVTLDNVTTSDIAKLTNALSQNGFSDFAIETL